MTPSVPNNSRVPRFGHGSRVPGWDDAVDLSKDPATIPDPATTPVPDELRATIEAAMARYPDRRSAALPALHAAQSIHGWCSPEAIDQVAAVMQLTPAYLNAVATFYDMLETRRRRVLRRDDPGLGRRRDDPRELLRVPGRVRHRAHGLGQR
jgi:hypothetical protein